jgi:hypothetical protein
MNLETLNRKLTASLISNSVQDEIIAFVRTQANTIEELTSTVDRYDATLLQKCSKDSE